MFCEKVIVKRQEFSKPRHSSRRTSFRCLQNGVEFFRCNINSIPVLFAFSVYGHVNYRNAIFLYELLWDDSGAVYEQSCIQPVFPLSESSLLQVFSQGDQDPVVQRLDGPLATAQHLTDLNVGHSLHEL